MSGTQAMPETLSPPTSVRQITGADHVLETSTKSHLIISLPSTRIVEGI